MIKLKHINIFDEVHKLNFPSDQYIVVGSGIMAVKGIREACDLDIVVSQELFEKCKSEDWEVMPWTRSGKLGKEWLKKGITDLMLEVMSGDKTFDLKTLVKEGEKVQGVWFMSLSQLIFFKKEYGRQKDFDDITLMEKYIKENSK